MVPEDLGEEGDFWLSIQESDCQNVRLSLQAILLASSWFRVSSKSSSNNGVLADKIAM